VERLHDVSDAYQIPVCGKCGRITNQQDKCTMCNDNDVRNVKIPYAAKLLKQNLEAMCINMIINTEK